MNRPLAPALILLALMLSVGCHRTPAPVDGIGDGTGRDLDLLAATKTLRTELAAHPDDAATSFALANVLARRGIFDEAIQLYKAVIADNDHHGAAWHNLALAYERQGLLRDAVGAAETAATLEPHNKLFAADAARIAIALKDATTGEKAFRAKLSDFYATVAAGGPESTANAAKLAESLIAGWPEESDAWNAAGISAARADQPTLAAERFDKAIELDPKDVQARYNCAIVAWSSGDREGAQYQLEILANLLKDDERALEYVQQLTADLKAGKDVADAGIAARERPVVMESETL